jgi:hypothetical protein
MASVNCINCNHLWWTNDDPYLEEPICMCEDIIKVINDILDMTDKPCCGIMLSYDDIEHEHQCKFYQER